MNLYDLVRRKDRRLAAHGLEACEPKRIGGAARAVRFEPGARARLEGAHEATAWSTFPRDPGWSIAAGGAATIRIVLVSGNARVVLAEVEARPDADNPVLLCWPLPVPRRFALEIECDAGLTLLVGPLVDARAPLRALVAGAGVEVGPGLNPAIRPAPGIEPRYVEQKPPTEWATTYAKRELTTEETALWDRYVVDSARHLSQFAPDSLAWIFSSHVLEHLVDPIGTLLAWWQRLAPGGVIAGVVPDARYTFDWRQPLQSIDEIRGQRGLGEAPTQAMYERWCRYTSPENSPDSLRSRAYSIHVTYPTPTLMRSILDEVDAALVEAGVAGADAIYVGGVTNGKDFAFAMRKPA